MDASRKASIAARMRLAALALVAAAASLLLGAAPASAAAPCSANFSDASGFVWDVSSESLGPGWSGELAGGFIADGSSDAYDGWGVLRVGSTAYLPAGDLATVCDTESGGREITFPPRAIGQLAVSRKVYVPASGLAFARFLEIVDNPADGGSDVTTNVSYEGDLGSDSATNILANAPSPRPGRWMTSDDTNPPEGQNDPPLAHVFDGPGSPTEPAVGVYGGTSGTTAWNDGEARVRAVYDVTVPEGQTITFMHFEAQRSTPGLALTAAQALGNVTAPDGFAGLSDTELSELVNWDPSDLDGDGVTSPSDNCRFVSNSSQADLDGDGQGDPCDSDRDGDGVADAVDACPSQAATGANGCPPAAPTPPAPTAPADTTAPTLKVVSRHKLKKRRFRKGITVAATTNEPCSIKLELFVRKAKSRRSRKKVSRLVSLQVLPKAGAGTRATIVKPTRTALRGTGRRVTARLRVTAEDAAGNRTVRTVVIKIR